MLPDLAQVLKCIAGRQDTSGWNVYFFDAIKKAKEGSSFSFQYMNSNSSGAERWPLNQGRRIRQSSWDQYKIRTHMTQEKQKFVENAEKTKC